ncbi:TonB-dependent receptor [Alteromonas sp. C1M14]|uniref:TonB-dependent receptor plug domain-containing protein n=1 Tax=Alteromonas sp. C1M14 TaxID=2841567 RepID=UPI001C086403|nr:TonB-dependent receptor [Alteromonas sp. C1M14]MBU2979627.1 TonB-dependent receptor [Alteromonas sp. C1M14]
MQLNKLAIAMALTGAATSALAATETQPEEAIEHVVVSSRVYTPLREVATSVSVVTQEDIQLRGYANLADVLRVQPAIHVTSSGGMGSATSLRIRGEEGYRTLVRVDGVDISDPTGTQVQPRVGQLLSNNINRVEILRGTQGLVYGADAGGVINVQTGHTEEGVYGGLRAEAGRYDTTNLSAEVGAGTQYVDAYLSVADYSTDGFNSRVDDDELQDDDGYDNTTVHAKVDVHATDRLTLGFVARNNEGEGEFDHCYSGGYVDDCTSEFSQQNLRLSADYALDSGHHQLAYAKTRVDRENFTLGESSYLTKGTIERVEYIGDTQLNDVYRLVYGVDWEEESITTAQQSRSQTGYYTELQTNPTDNFFATAGLRYDDNEDFGQHVSYRLSSAYLWQVNDGELKLRGAYGTGFRAPSLYEIEYNRGPYAYAPASETDLKEETSKGYEIGLEYRVSGATSFEVVYFNQEIEDSIYFDLASYSGYLQDLGTSYSEGVELIGQWAISNQWRIDANYTYNHTEDTDGEQRSRRPRQLGNVGVTYQTDQFTASANVRLVADAVDNGTPLKDYALIDLSARYDFSDNLSVFGRLENALNEDYQDLSDYNTSAAALHAGVSYTF